MRTKALTRFASCLVIVIGVLFATLPIAWMISTSFKTYQEAFSVPPRWIPANPTFANFINIWKDYPLATYFKNSLVIVIAATALAITASTLTGFGLTRLRFRGKTAFATFILTTQMFPSVMMVIPYFAILRKYGLVNTYTGLVLAYASFTIPLCSWMMVGYFRSISLELDDAAAIDGCSRFETFYRIILPLTRPGLAATAIYAFLQGWNEYLFPLVLTTTNTMMPLSVGIGNMVGQYRIAWNDLMAASLVASLPLIVVFVLLQRHFVAGLAAGAVKQ